MKNSSKRAGISLVALIVTIIVLIILTAAVIVTFMEGGVIDRAKESVFKSDIRTYQEILAVKRAEEQIKLATGNGEEEELKLIDKTITGEAIKEILPEFKEEEYGELIEVTNGEIVAKKELDEEVLQEKWLIDLGIKKGEASIPITFTKASEGELTVGSELIASNGERFYLMENSGSTLTLLAKGTINTTTYTQESPNDVQFSSIDFWWDYDTESLVSNFSDGNLNDIAKVPEGAEAYALEAAIAYGEKLSGRGRLMTKAEAESWQDGGELEVKLYETGNYWLGDATLNNTYGSVWNIAFSGFLIDFAWSSTSGVRPVITISESAVN